MIKYFVKQLLGRILPKLDKQYVRPRLDYGGIMYHKPAAKCEYSKLINRFEKFVSVQSSAENCAWTDPSREKLFHELG